MKNFISEALLHTLTVAVILAILASLSIPVFVVIALVKYLGS